ncbi:hypothetical protein HRG_002831 [Hirsutella rhossiliensis]|uniref:Uncharacterized protein n=1 Tax=Hirsutella rhossiliensis TaxID=111463 RepID=A0A9P8N0W5_9HYPO|nr:uncharacterized protein HRG_02831 [Hirsutella rhossiliensis]KAH0964815.1 hypothetical protein HRG_02831 [Hirsutella rhossiliensis]
MDIDNKTANSSSNKNSNARNNAVGTMAYVGAPGLDHSAFFVRLRDERTPVQWVPTDSQLRTDVARIVYAAAAPEDPAPEDQSPHQSPQPPPPPPPSCAYLAFPKTSGGPDGKHAGSWDAAQSTAAVRTAVDVLVGQKGHDVFRLHTGTEPGAEAGTSIGYGLATLRPTDVHALHPVERNQGQRPPAPRDIYLEQRDLADDHVALVLPGFYPRAADCLAVVAVADLLSRGISSSARAVAASPGLVLPGAAAAAAASRIRVMVARFLDAVDDAAERRKDLAAELRHVRLLVGSPADGSEPRHQKQLLLPLGDKPGSVLDPEAADALAVLADAPPRSILVFPEYRRRDTRMLPGWARSAGLDAMDADDGASVALPPLGSSAKEFRQHVAELCRLVPRRGNEELADDLADGLADDLAYDPRLHHVSIHPLLPTPSSEKGAEEWDAPFESSTFFLGPDATDDDWFRVRAQIPTRKAVVRVWPASRSLDWRMSVARSNVWGPRYGRVVAAPQTQHTLVPFYRTPMARGSGTLGDVFAPVTQAPVVPQQRPDPVIECPFANCGFNWKPWADEARNQRVLEAHARVRHVVRQCLWCDEPLGEFWNDGERDEHLRRKHSHHLMALLGVQRMKLHHRDGGSGSVVASVPLMPVDSSSAAASAPVRQPLTQTAASRPPAPPADEDEEPDKENDPGALPDDRIRFNSSDPSVLAAPMHVDINSDLWAIGARYLRRLLTVPPSTEALVAPTEQQKEPSLDNDFDVYEDIEEEEVRGDNGTETRGRAMSEPPAILGNMAGTTTLQPAMESRQQNEQSEEANEGQGPEQDEEPKKLEEEKQSVETSGPARGKKRQRAADNPEDAEAATDEPVANKRKKTAKTAQTTKTPKAAKATKATRTAESMKTVETTKSRKTAESIQTAEESKPKKATKPTGAGKSGRTAETPESTQTAAATEPVEAAKPKKTARATKATKAKSTPAQKKRKAPEPSTNIPEDDDAPAPKRAKKHAVPPAPPLAAEPTRRSARLRGKAKKN